MKKPVRVKRETINKKTLVIRNWSNLKHKILKFKKFPHQSISLLPVKGFLIFSTVSVLQVAEILQTGSVFSI